MCEVSSNLQYIVAIHKYKKRKHESCGIDLFCMDTHTHTQAVISPTGSSPAFIFSDYSSTVRKLHEMNLKSDACLF